MYKIITGYEMVCCFEKHVKVLKGPLHNTEVNIVPMSYEICAYVKLRHIVYMHI